MGYVLIDETMLSTQEQKAIQVTRLIESGKIESISTACKQVGISRSGYYKYKNYIPLDCSGFNLEIKIDFTNVINATKGIYTSDILYKKTPVN